MICPICDNKEAVSLADYLRHIRLHHADRPNFRVKCNLQNCQTKPYHNFCYFRNHVYDYHDNIVVKKSTTRPMDPPDMADTCDGTGYHSSDSEIAESPNLEKRMEDIQRASAIWILKIRECHKLTQVTTESIIKDVDSLYQVALNNIQCAVEGALKEVGILPSQIPELNAILSSTGPYGKLFSGLETNHRQLVYMKSHFKLVVGVK